MTFEGQIVGFNEMTEAAIIYDAKNNKYWHLATHLFVGGKPSLDMFVLFELSRHTKSRAFVLRAWEDKRPVAPVYHLNDYRKEKGRKT